MGLLFFSAYSIYQKHLVFSEMEALQGLANVAPDISGVVHELQKERGTSAVYIGSKGAKFAKELPTQHTATNAAIETMDMALKSFDARAFGATLTTKLETAQKALSELNAKRTGVTGFDLTVPQMASYYTGTIAKLLSIVEEMAVISTNAQVTKTITAYTSFLQAKERAGQERAMGGAGFGAAKFAPPVYRRMTELIAEQKVLLFTFNIYASETQRAALKNIVQGKEVDEVERMRKIAIDSLYSGTTEGVEGPYWFGTITKKIDKLKEVEDVISDELKGQAETIKGAASTSFYLFLAATAVLLLITAGLVYVIVTGITRPVVGLTATMRTLADGDTSVHVSGTHRGDEIGSMSQAVEVFKENMIKNQHMAAEQEKENAAKEQKRIAMENMASRFETDVTGVLREVSSASSTLQGTAESMAATAEETSKQSTVVAAAAEEASTNVQTVASAAEELSSSISEISRQVSQSTQVAGAAVHEVEGANEKVQGLAEAANKIGEVVALITDIADQTNLLALNATIEAARAGEAGKGFAVVASEVKNLANQTAKATEEISNQIGGIQGATQDAVQAIKSIGGTIGQMSEIASAIAAAVEEQGAATQEIARNVEQAAAGTGEVTSNISGVNEAANETGQAAEMVLSAVTTLTAESDKLSHQVQDFLTGLKKI
ncbi:methyl-accepting chemotaxis protein [Magnetovibrio sp.]|uniref:methyl-accepting chemotaxis protein n=1 Tax=Magnetovibrio sp. TaxID=2024836 RepID=UPI002F921F0D